MLRYTSEIFAVSQYLQGDVRLGARRDHEVAAEHEVGLVPLHRTHDREEVAGIDEADSLPRTASFNEGVHNMEVLAAVTESAGHGGASIEVAPQRKLALQESGSPR